MMKRSLLLFISSLWLTLLNYPTYAVAQQTFNNLPSCAQRCANAAAERVYCSSDDITCLCNTPFTRLTMKCVNSKLDCTLNEIQSTQVDLNGMCADVPITDSTSSDSSITSSTETSSTSSQLSTPTSTSIPSTTSSTITPAAPICTNLPLPTSTELASSTTFVVTTVIVHPSTTSTSAAGRLDISMGIRALAGFLVGLPSIISIITVI